MGNLHPLLCPTLIGRTAERDHLARWLAQAGSAMAPVMLISGEAGIGKSRLAAEARQRVAELRGLSLQGRCFEPDQSLPYAPLRDLLAAYCAALSPPTLRAALGPGTTQLVKIFPELLTLLTDLAPAPTVVPPDQEKRQLFDALAQFFNRLSHNTDAPLLLVIEDIHWSDDASLDCLLHLCHRPDLRSTRFILTCRRPEALARPVVSRFLAELDRGRLAAEINLSGLTLDNIDSMLRAIFALQRPPRRDFVQRLYADTEGNPFFVEEILKTLSIPVGGFDDFTQPALALQIPPSIQVAVQERLKALSPAAHQVVTLAAVMGRRFDFTLLQTLAQLSETELIALIKELIQAQLVVEESEETFAFRHALTRQAVYTDLLTRERKQLHQTIAQAILRLYPSEEHLADLAYHFYAAGEWEQVWTYARQAGGHAVQLYAPQAAIEHFTHALEAGQKLSSPSIELWEVYRSRAGAFEALGDFDSARIDHESALQLARTSPDPRAEQQSLLQLGMLWASHDYARTGDYFRQALQAARAEGDPTTIAHSLNRFGNWLANVERPLEALPYHEEARQIFETLQDAAGLAETLDLLGTTSLHAGDMLAGAAYYQAAVRLFRQLDDRPGLVSALAMLEQACGSYLNPILVHAPGALSDVLRYGEEAIQLARQTGQRPAEAFALSSLAICLGPRGGYARAFDLAQTGLQVANAIEHRQFLLIAHTTLGALYLDLLDLQRAAQELNEALSLAQESGSAFWLHITASLTASTNLLQNQLARADALLNTMLTKEALTLPERESRGAQRLTWYARAQLALAQGDAARTLQIVEALLASTPNLTTQGSATIPWLALLQGQALVALRRSAEAEPIWQAAAEFAFRDGLVPIQWRLQAALAQLYHRERRGAEADQETEKARRLIDSLAANIPDLVLQATFQSAALATLPQRSPRRLAKQAFAGLTSREREVAAQVARGHSNKTIASDLVVSERTIEKHIENILSKLGFTSRAQIAVWAAEKGLNPKENP